MSSERIPTATEFGEFCKPEVYLQGMLGGCFLEGDRPFLGCQFAYFVDTHRLCKHPSLHQLVAPADKPASEKIPPNADSGSNAAKKEISLAAAEPSKISPRSILREKNPQLLLKIEQMWGSIELHQFFERTNRLGFPPDVLYALEEMESKHRSVMKSKAKIAGN